MTKAMREILSRLADAEGRAQSALAGEDGAAAEAAMEEVRTLRAQKAALEREEREWREPARNGRRIDGNGARSARHGEIQALKPSERIADHRDAVLPDGIRAEELSLGRVVRGLVTGKWNGAEAEREFFAQQSTTPGSAGGYLVPEPLSTQLIDLARNQTRVIQAGALTVPMDSKTLTIAKVTGDPSGTWKAENAPGSFSAMGFDAVTFEAKTLMALVKMSVELFEDARNISQVVETALAAALAVELDRVALRGSGTAEEPLGILNTEGVQKMSAVGEVAYTHFSRAVQRVEEANGVPVAAIYAPRTGGELDRLVDSTGQPLDPLPSFERLTKYTTNQVPTDLGANSDESEAYVGDFSQVLIGSRTNLVIEATRVGAATEAGEDMSAFQDLQVWIRAYLRADVQIAKPEHLVVLEGITPPEEAAA